MEVTLLGIVTPVISEFWKADALIAVTGRPLIVEGIDIATPGPVYPVIVILPSDVPVVNWA